MTLNKLVYNNKKENWVVTFFILFYFFIIFFFVKSLCEVKAKRVVYICLYRVVVSLASSLAVLCGGECDWLWGGDVIPCVARSPVFARSPLLKRGRCVAVRVACTNVAHIIVWCF